MFHNLTNAVILKPLAGKKAKLQLEVVYPSETLNILQRCTIIETGAYEQNSNGTLAPTMMLDFAPLRPLRALVQV
jgi:hypothetical protein